VWAQTPQGDNSWDFENGLQGWTKTGSAFDSHPVNCSGVHTDFPANLVRVGGDYWWGLPYPLGQHGHCLIVTEDRRVGSLASSGFTLRAETPYLNLLIGGSDDLAHERFELQIFFNSSDDATELERLIKAWSASEHRILPDGLRRDGKYVTALAVTGNKDPDGLTLELLQARSFHLPAFLLGRTARFSLIDDSTSAHINLDFVRFTKTPDSYRGPVWGYADFHTHPASHVAFGGVRGIHTVWGNPGTAAADYDNGKLVACDIPHCTAGHDGGPTAEIVINEIEERGRKLTHKRSGGPEFKDFPSFLSGTHQQMHITQIRRNYEGGLRLMVALVTNNRAVEYLMSKFGPDGNIPPPSTDREVLEAGLQSIKNVVKLNKEWMEIASTPDEARRIIGENKLAVVLGVEVDQLGQLNSAEPESAEKEVEYLWTLGVRAVTPIHGTDNRLGGTAVFRDLYNGTNDFLYRGAFNLTKDDLPNYPPHFFQVREGGCLGPLFEQRGECVLFRLSNPQQRLIIKNLFGRRPFPEDVPAPMYDNFLGHKNVHGLTTYGREYIAALMNRGMIIDTAHMSDASVQDVFDVIGTRLKEKHPVECSAFALDADLSKIPRVCFDDAYPTIISHAHFRAQSFYEKPTLVGLARPSEYQISKRNVEMLQRIGGVIGPFVAEKPLDVPPDQYLKPPFKNDCAGSSKGFAYSLLYALQKMNGQGVGMATDFTFIPGTAPRFGDEACWAYNLASDPKQEQRLNPELYDRYAQTDRVVYRTDPIERYPKVKNGYSGALIPYKMDQRSFDFNVDGLANYGLIPDMLQDLKNLGLPPKDFEALFASAESYVKTWEKALRVARH
jgi:microsomal dipeptidase-like Zn-dependent dipeptidase